MPISSASRRDWAWPAALALASLVGTAISACLMPFVAIAVACAATMRVSRALAVIAGVWAINQTVGFVALGFPHTAFTIGWGLAIGGASLVAFVAAHRLLRGRHRLGPELAIAFLAGFIAYESSLFAFARLAGGTGTFTASIIGQILLNDGCWFAGLILFHQLLTRSAPRLFGAPLAFA
jgi:hypothetical protein